MQPPFISIADLGNHLNRDIPVDDERAIIALDAACQTVRTYVEQTLNLVRGDVQRFRGFPPFMLPELPVVQINSITINGDPVEDDEWYLGFGGVIFVKEWRRWWRTWEDEVVVDYDHGWAIQEADIVQDESGEGDVDRMPADIRMVALRIAAGLSSAVWSGVTAGLKSETLGAYSYTVADGTSSTGELSDPEKRILDRHRVKRIPVP